MTGKGEASEICVEEAHKKAEPLTQPSVIKLLSSVNCKTNSSSSIVQVSLVECCLGINKVVTLYLLPRSLPNKRPQVSLFISVLTFAIARKRERHSRGRVTTLSMGEGSPVGLRTIRSDSARERVEVEEEEVVDAEVEVGPAVDEEEGGGPGGPGTGGAGRVGPR